MTIASTGGGFLLPSSIYTSSSYMRFSRARHIGRPSTMTTANLPIHRLPLPSTTLQSSLTQLDLDPSPISARRATTFKTSTEGIWARVHPLWAAWPLRVTKEELLEMGVDVDAGQDVKVEDVLARWDPVDRVSAEGEEKGQLGVYTSTHRLKLDAYLLGVSEGTLNDSLPHLDADPSLASDSAANQALTDVLSGRHILASEDGKYGPWSTRYCGHQFGTWAGQLGDGRAISLLETTSAEGGRQEIQLKGAGRTPFSRTADGLAVLRSGVREYLGCEAIAALNIPTTRALALLAAPSLPVVREYGPEPTSLTARIAPSFIRIGHFEALSPSKSARDSRQMFFGGSWRGASADDDHGPLAGQGNLEGLRKLVEWCKGIMVELGWIPQGAGTRVFFEEVVKRNAEMVAGWQAYGFCHGVINTDNVSILGLTIDYGPYAFMDVYDENHICNHSDPSGLYSYSNQPDRILFALDKLYQSLAPLIGYEAAHPSASSPSVPAGWSDGATADDVDAWRDEAEVVTKGWEERYWDIQKKAENALWIKRFGLTTQNSSDDTDIIQPFKTLLHAHNMDFHTSFRRLSYFSVSRATSTSADSCINAYVTSFVQAGIVARREEEVGAAIEGWKGWFGVYARRILEDGKSEGEGPEGERRERMNGVNPRFVLRQWVLEELIKGMEEGVKAGTAEGKAEARGKLANILKMSASPFEIYGEDVADGACPTPEVEEERRLCGPGSREMLGFQCSCSS